ncbi:transglycosylase SLT domain-containing protein [Streptomyces sp. NPDC006879]|uniref:transglycosylase SLT domain-containing protein n=1 Tax=Streptomyces sp. NPDC006879 TaxID=3364767 RepID=UPI0036C17B82
MPAKGKHRRTKRNALARRFLVAGTGSAVLALPVMGAATAQAAPSSAAVLAAPKAAVATTAVAAVQAKASTVTYAVVAGDSLSKIAEKHAVSGGWKQLYSDNRGAVGVDPSLIHPGLELTIGAKAKASAGAGGAIATVAAAGTTSSAKAVTATQTAVKAAAKTYANNLDGWIRESLDIMAKHGIPGTYAGIHRNIMRESSGNPLAINNWDINARNGIPSKGLLQVIDPTFRAYHVPGTSFDSYDPVANITAACNYAAKRYGSIDNVFGAY